MHLVSTELTVYVKYALQILTLALLWKDAYNIVQDLMKFTKEVTVCAFLDFTESTKYAQNVQAILFTIS